MPLHNFTPVSASIGGAMIGTATVLYFVLNGKYAGISGILRGAVFGDPERTIDVAFAGGLIAAGFVAHPLVPQAFANGPNSMWAVAAGGILVGVGTALGGGCTSGHGVCGLGRLSARSLVAVAVFVGAGIATATLAHLIRHAT